MVFNIEPRRRLSDLEIVEAAELAILMEAQKLSEEEDTRGWGKERNIFIPRIVWKTLSDLRRAQGVTGYPDFPGERVWHVRNMPPKISFFVWTVIRGRVLTVDNLKKRGMILVNRCQLCESAEETLKHLFLECEITERIWHYFRHSAGITPSHDGDLSNVIKQGHFHG